MNERTGIVEELQANRLKYARYAYVAPHDRLAREPVVVAPVPKEPTELSLADKIIADFDTGGGRREIADRYGVEYDYVTRVLFKARRTARSRGANDLTGEQLKLYRVLVETGVSARRAKIVALEAAK